MKKWSLVLLTLLLLAGCAKTEEQAVPTTTPETAVQVAVEATLETTVETTVPEETVPEEPPYRYPSRRVTNGKEVYDFGMAMYNDTQSALTVVSMHVADYVAGEEVASKTYSGWELDVYNGDRPAKYVMQPGYPLVLFMEENVSKVTFEERYITVLLQTESGEQTERIFRFVVDDAQEALYPDPEEAPWVPATLDNSSWRFPCTLTNETDQVLTLTGMYSLQYINSNAVRFSYRTPGDSYIAEIAKLEPGESVTWTDGIAVKNMFATHRKYVMRYEDPQGNVYEQGFWFVAEKEN